MAGQRELNECRAKRARPSLIEESLEHTLLVLSLAVASRTLASCAAHCLAVDDILQPFWSPAKDLLLESCGNVRCLLAKVLELRLDSVPFLCHMLLRHTHTQHAKHMAM